MSYPASFRQCFRKRSFDLRGCSHNALPYRRLILHSDSDAGFSPLDDMRHAHLEATRTLGRSDSRKTSLRTGLSPQLPITRQAIEGQPPPPPPPERRPSAKSPHPGTTPRSERRSHLLHPGKHPLRNPETHPIGNDSQWNIQPMAQNTDCCRERQDAPFLDF